MSRSYQTEGIIIKRANFAEKDKLITLLSKKHGKLVILAKGIRTLHSRRAPHLELFNFVKITLSLGKTFDIITEAESIEVFPRLRVNLDKVAYAYKMVEQVERLCAERQIQKNIFVLLLEALEKIDGDNLCDLPLIVDEFSLKLLWELGYLPHDESIKGEVLDQFIENVMERNLKSKSLLTRL